MKKTTNSTFISTPFLVARLIAGMATFFIALFFNWLCLPAITFKSEGFWFFLICMFGIAACLFAIAEYVAGEHFDGESRIRFWAISAIISGVMLLALGILAWASSPMFNASSYRILIEIEEGNFETDIPKVTDVNNIAVVDTATAQRVGNTTLGGLQKVSQFEINKEYNLIVYNGQQYRISPLEYGGLFKFNKNKSTGIPGFVLVNSMTQKAELIQLDNGIKYSPSAFYEYNLNRHLRNNYSNYLFDKAHFEIDDDNNPFWIVPVKEASISLFGGKVVKSFIVVDACSGKTKEYTLDDLESDPEIAWIDHVYSLSYLMAMAQYNYHYVNGFWNPSNEGVRKLSYEWKDSTFAGYNSIISADGVSFFTGVTSSGRDESIFGFILANTRTGKVKFYSCKGSEESYAQGSAQGIVPNYGYTASYPTIVNVDGIKTYYMSLKDASGLVKMHALINVEDISHGVAAGTLEEAILQYKQKLGSKVEEVSEDNIVEKSGIIAEIFQTTVVDGYTYFNFTLEGDSNLYVSSIANSHLQVKMAVGDRVTIKYVNSEDSVKYIVKIVLSE